MAKKGGGGEDGGERGHGYCVTPAGSSKRIRLTGGCCCSSSSTSRRERDTEGAGRGGGGATGCPREGVRITLPLQIKKK